MLENERIRLTAQRSFEDVQLKQQQLHFLMGRLSSYLMLGTLVTGFAFAAFSSNALHELPYKSDPFTGFLFALFAALAPAIDRYAETIAAASELNGDGRDSRSASAIAGALLAAAKLHFYSDREVRRRRASHLPCQPRATACAPSLRCPQCACDGYPCRRRPVCARADTVC